MFADIKWQHCNKCKCNTRHERRRTTELWGFVLTVLTCGLWAPIWVMTSIIDTARGYSCGMCGGR
jgi:hypothetical protein